MSPLWFSSMLEFRLWMFPSEADELIKDYMGMGDLGYLINQLFYDVERVAARKSQAEGRGR